MLTCYGVYDDIGMQGAVFLFIAEFFELREEH